MEKRRVLFLIPNLLQGGAERVLVNLANHMDPGRFAVTVRTMFDTGIYRDRLAPHVRYIGGFPWYFRGNTVLYKLVSPKTLFRWYVKEPYDVIVSYLEGPSARVAAGCPEGRTRLVCWVHGEQGTLSYAAKPFRSAKEAEACYGRFHRIVCVSRAVRADFRRLFPHTAEPLVLYNTVESDRIRREAEEPLPPGTFREGALHLVSVAKLQAVKGYDRLLRVLSRLDREGAAPPFTLTLVGAGEEQARLEKQAAACGLADRVSFAGFRENPYKFVKNADLYVCSSRREGFSTAVTEALIVGTPVLSTDCSGARELLGEQNEYGLVVENSEEGLYEGLKTMLDRETLAEYREKARRRGELFQTEATVRAVEDMLWELGKS